MAEKKLFKIIKTIKNTKIVNITIILCYHWQAEAESLPWFQGLVHGILKYFLTIKITCIFTV